MRLDKYLKVARIIKKRTTGNTIAKQEKVLVNGKIAKPGQQLKYGDIISIHFANRLLSVRVLSTFLPKPKSEELMYEVIASDFHEKKESD